MILQVILYFIPNIEQKGTRKKSDQYSKHLKKKDYSVLLIIKLLRKIYLKTIYTISNVFIYHNYYTQ